MNIKTKIIAIFACFSVLWIAAFISHQLMADPAYPLLVASMGATAVIVFIMPTSPLAQPWPVLGGHLVSAFIGVTCAQTIHNIPLAAACAAGGSVFAMLLLRCLHPPGAATAITPVLGAASLSKIGFNFVLFPVGLNFAVLLILAIIINRYVLGHQYPTSQSIPASAQAQPSSGFIQQTGVSEQDLEQALQDQETFIDISPNQLNELLLSMQRQNFQRSTGNLICADIMDRQVISLDYGTTVEAAWHAMHVNKLKAMPVLDKAYRVIGLLTWDDFFNHIEATRPNSFAQKFRAFVKPSDDIYTSKPESVGHLMTKPVAVLRQTAPIAELIPLISAQNNGYVPIVNEEKRLVGMVNPSQLIAAIYRQEACNLYRS